VSVKHFPSRAAAEAFTAENRPDIPSDATLKRLVFEKWPEGYVVRVDFSRPTKVGLIPATKYWKES